MINRLYDIKSEFDPKIVIIKIPEDKIYEFFEGIKMNYKKNI